MRALHALLALSSRLPVHALGVGAVVALWFATALYVDVARVRVAMPATVTLAALKGAGILALLVMVVPRRAGLHPRNRPLLYGPGWHWQVPVAAACLVGYLLADHVAITMVSVRVNRSFHALAPSLVVTLSRVLEGARYPWAYYAVVSGVALSLGSATVPIMARYTTGAQWGGGALCYVAVMLAAAWIVMMSRMLRQGWRPAQIVFCVTGTAILGWVPVVVVMEGRALLGAVKGSHLTLATLWPSAAHTTVYTIYLFLFCVVLARMPSVHVAVLQNLHILLLFATLWALGGARELSFFSVCLATSALCLALYAVVAALVPVRSGARRKREGLGMEMSEWEEHAFLATDVELQRAAFSDEEDF